GEERLACEASWNRFGCLDKSPGVGVRRKERSHRLGLARSGCPGGTKKLQELLAGADGEAIGGMSDNIRVNVIGQVEPDGDSTRTGPGWIIVRNRRQARGVRVAHGYWRRGPARVWGPGQPGRFG